MTFNIRIRIKLNEKLIILSIQGNQFECLGIHRMSRCFKYIVVAVVVIVAILYISIPVADYHSKLEKKQFAHASKFLIRHCSLSFILSSLSVIPVLRQIYSFRNYILSYALYTTEIKTSIISRLVCLVSSISCCWSDLFIIYIKCKVDFNQKWWSLWIGDKFSALM